MAQSMFEQAGEQFSNTAHKASRAASAVKDAVEDGMGAARRAAKQGRYAAAELIDDTKRRVQRHPVETVVATFAAGIAAGTAIGWMVRRRHHCNKTEVREKAQSCCGSSSDAS
jgi:ElaB/YqjD/DUF883 family membrane-anchored ribosome-binding protein